MTFIPPLDVDRLVGRDRIQPRSKATRGIKLVALQMHLQKGALERIFSHLGIADIASEVTVDFALVAPNQRLVKAAITRFSILGNQALVGDVALRRPRSDIGLGIHGNELLVRRRDANKK